MVGRRIISFGKREKSKMASHHELLCKTMMAEGSGIGGKTLRVRNLFKILRTKNGKKRLDKRPDRPIDAKMDKIPMRAKPLEAEKPISSLMR